MDTTTTIATNETKKLSAIEAALAKAKARKAARVDVDDDATTTATAEARPVKAIASTAERDAKRAAIAADREARKAARDTKRAEAATKKAAAERGPVHMKKVERAASKLPKLIDEAQLHVNDIVANFSAEQISAIALHLQHHNRVAATMRATGVNLEAGMAVRIIGGDPRFIGMTGTVDRAQRIRCYVEVPGFRKHVYLFTSDVEPVTNTAVAVAAG